MTQEFVTDKAKYVYDTKLISIQQATLAEEILRFKYEQQQREPDTWEAIEKSGGIDWFPNCASALLTRIDGDKTVDFTVISWSAAKDFVRKLNYLEQAKLRECLEDFFCSIQKESMLLAIFTPKSSKPMDKILSRMVEQALKVRNGETHTSIP